MKETLRIILGTDFSDSSKSALSMLKLILKKYSAEVDIVHVITEFWQHFISNDVLEKEIKQRLITWQNKLPGKFHKEESVHVLLGSASEKIIMFANQSKANLIVLGGKERGYKHFLSGTTAESVVRYAPQAVLLAKTTKIETIICGIDSSNCALETLTFAIDFSKRFNAELQVIHVIAPPTYNPLGMEEKEVKKLEKKYKTKSMKTITDRLKKFGFDKYNIKPNFLWGRPSNVLINMADDLNADLIIVGATGVSRTKRLLIGSTAEKILRDTPCSLLVYR